jgi:hypothetical protein
MRQACPHRKKVKNPLDRIKNLWYNKYVNEGSPRQARVTVQVSKAVTMSSTLTSLKKKLKNLLTNEVKYGIIKM